MASLAICANNSLQRPELRDTHLSTLGHHKCLANALRHTLKMVYNRLVRQSYVMQMRALVEMDNSGLVVLLEQAQYEDLARMCSLFKRLDEGLNMIRTIMGEHLKSAGSALVQDPESTKDPVDFVHRLLAMKDKYDRCVHLVDSRCKLMYVKFWLPKGSPKACSLGRQTSSVS